MPAMTYIHIIAGTIAVLAGAAALLTTKGSRMHRLVGNAFFISMVIMALGGIYLAIVLPMAISILVGVFTIYLVATSWMAARRHDEQINLLHYVALAMTLGVAAGGLWFGMEAQSSPDGLKDGLPAFPHYFFGGLGLLAALGDGLMIARRGITGKRRIARHLWRMCFAYFIAAGSLFTGPGATAFPDAIRDTGLLSVPEPIILVIMLFWVVRVLATKWYDGQ
ncbi:DUF2306 domain-containing protein [Parasphingorhabdus cellanae]|uniref:DUF2306 domain-containing protein n=1 Tax=Parasphingorhabdus cellanae TaxID=2806553 RepID=A0ABX7T415_9SPHN|nr:DUF2306 domain-containing protein [Parasphingorhabdus cellanae]QTD54990.1 DUF2306 domain-containing protein [Parasphingorhabdus cellanae]